MRARILLAVLALSASACTFLFPLDGLIPDAGTDAGAGGANDGGDGGTVGDASGEAATGSYPDEVLADHPVLYLRLGEKSGTTARDETQHTTPTYGGHVVLGAPGALLNDGDTAATFDGNAGSTVSIPGGNLDFPGMASFSVEVWARQTTANEFGWAVDHQVYGNRNGWSLRFSKADTAFERWTDNVPSGIAWQTTLVLNRYQHVVATFDGTTATARLYVDGKEALSGPSANSLHAIPTSWSLGSQNCACNSSDFIGSLDEFAVYDKALPADRVAAHYRASGR